MADTKGTLPGSGRPENSTAAAQRIAGGSEPQLPTAGSGSGERRLPPLLRKESPGLHAIEPPEPPAALPAKAGKEALYERLAAAALAGGLTTLPAGFGDAEGDWMTIRSDNPFEVLYLDYRQAHQLTPQQVDRHRTLLLKFWQEKLKSMSQGAGRLAVVKKYGGEHQSEGLVRSYPDLLERAYHRLSTIQGIAEAYQEITSRREKAVLARIDEKLADFLVDSVLHPQEIQALFELADRGGVARERVAGHIQDQLRAAGFSRAGEVRGSILEQQLLSSAWARPSRPVSGQPEASEPGGIRVSWLQLAVVMALLVVGTALGWYRRDAASPDPSGDRGLVSPSVPVVETPPERPTVSPRAAPTPSAMAPPEVPPAPVESWRRAPSKPALPDPPQPAPRVPFPSQGIWIVEVERGSQAERAGFRVGQVLIRLNDTVISEARLANSVIGDSIGYPITAVVWDAGTERTLEVTPDNPLIGVTLCRFDRCPGMRAP